LPAAFPEIDAGPPDCDMRLAGLVAVVTGASSGIGSAIATSFAREGAAVVVNYRRNEAGARAVVDSITAGGGRATMVEADISRSEGVDVLFDKTLSSFETVDILVNNAGIMHPKPFLELTAHDVTSVFETNTLGPLLCAQAAGRIMLPKRAGRIVNVASISGLPGFGTPGNVAYAISKAALVSLTGVLAKALAPHVNVNGVAPGFVEGTRMPASPEYVARTSEIYLSRPLEPCDVAKACVFLASADARAMTGEVIVVDAGFQLR
jgi:3-oxoacyl-[acyl-carrier protein] reductase